MEKNEYIDKNIEYLEDINNSVNDIKTTLIILSVTHIVFILIIGGFLFYLFMMGPN